MALIRETPRGSFARRLAQVTLGASLLACSDPPPLRPKPALPEETAPSASTSVSEPVASAAPTTPEPFVPKRVSLEEGAMGTKITLVAYTTPELDETKIGPALTKGYQEIRRLERLMSTWIEDSEVSRINAAAGKDFVEVGPETFAVIDKSVWIGKASGGVFDITFEAMHGLWKFDNGGASEIPPKSAIEKARKKIDYRVIELDPKRSGVRLAKPGYAINLGGIAKGYAVDSAARVIQEQGVNAFIVQAGGDLYVKGKKPDGSRFRVGIRDPRGKNDQDFFAVMEVEDHAFSTAGDYERAFVQKNKRYHHIIDPRTGYPATASRSVTIWAKDAFTADAIDDAVFILGAKKGLELVESIDGAGAVIVDDKNNVTISERLGSFVYKQRDPTDAP